LRRYCTEHGIVLIFDEVVTGFRVPEYSVSTLWRVQPDLICLGKALGNGAALAVVAGKAEIMNGDYYISSTASCEVSAMSQAYFNLKDLQKEDLYALQARGQAFFTALNAKLPPSIQFAGFGSRWKLNMDNPGTRAWVNAAARKGYLFFKSNYLYLGHSQAVLDRALEELFL
jgi:glutamate-1-semialdehyde aminotransferase